MGIERYKMDRVKNYITKLYQFDQIIPQKEFKEKTSLKYYCPVIDDSVAAFLNIFVKAINPKSILELGTSIGYSTTILANAIKEIGGCVTTVELDKRAVKAAMENFERYGVKQYINIVNDDVLKVLPNLEKKYDLIFLDLFNGIYGDVLNSCIDLLKSGGVLIADDTLFPVIKDEKIFEDSNKKLHEFNYALANRDDVESYLLPLDDGITIAVKK